MYNEQEHYYKYILRKTKEHRMNQPVKSIWVTFRKE
jgi:hypothetical protein